MNLSDTKKLTQNCNGMKYIKLKLACLSVYYSIALYVYFYIGNNHNKNNTLRLH